MQNRAVGPSLAAINRILPCQVGYGDIAPQTATEEIVAMFIMLVGVLFFGFIIGSLSEAMQALGGLTQSDAAR
jgi:Ion channel